MDLGLLTDQSRKTWLNIRVEDLRAQDAQVNGLMSIGEPPLQYTLPVTRGLAGEVLTSNGGGGVQWLPEANIFDQSLNTYDDVQFDSIEVNHAGDAEMVMMYAPDTAYVYEGVAAGADIVHRVLGVDTLVARFNELGSSVESNLSVTGGLDALSVTVAPGPTSYSLPPARALIGAQVLTSDGLGGSAWSFPITTRGSFYFEDHTGTTIFLNGGVGTWGELAGGPGYTLSNASDLVQGPPYQINNLGPTRDFLVVGTFECRLDAVVGNADYRFSVFVNGVLQPQSIIYTQLFEPPATLTRMIAINALVNIPTGGNITVRAMNMTDARDAEAWNASLSIVSI